MREYLTITKSDPSFAIGDQKARDRSIGKRSLKTSEDGNGKRGSAIGNLL